MLVLLFSGTEHFGGLQQLHNLIGEAERGELPLHLVRAGPGNQPPPDQGTVEQSQSALHLEVRLAAGVHPPHIPPDHHDLTKNTV